MDHAYMKVICICSIRIYRRVYTFSILDSWNVSLKLGDGPNPLLQTNFLKRKETDFFPRAFLFFSMHTSLHLSIITLIVLSISSSSLSPETLKPAVEIRRLTSKLDGQLRNLSNGRSAAFWIWRSPSTLVAGTAGFRRNSFVSSFWSFPTSSGVKSASSSSSGDDGVGGFWFCLWSEVWFGSWFPNVPIASNPWGQSLNSSFGGSCFGGPTKMD